MSRRAAESLSAAHEPTSDAAAIAPGKVTRTQRMAKASAPPPSQRAIDPVAAAIQRRQLERDLDASVGFFDDGAVAEHAARGVSGSGQTLPHLDTIQRAFGPHDVSGVRAHVGGAAAAASEAIGAHGYATGNDVAFAAPPDLALAAHEAAHVVQQRQGVQLSGAVGQVGDVYEQHADAVAAAVVRGDSAAALLGEATGGGGAAVQRKPINTTTTPDTPPGPVPAGPVATPSDEAHLDGEGNTIALDNGHWHLTEPPKAPSKRWYTKPPRPELLPINPNQAFDALRAEVVAIHAQQCALAESLKGDMNYWFAKVYSFVTQCELKQIDNLDYQYPHMKLQEVIHFNATYQANLAAWRAGSAKTVEAHWKKAFELAQAEAGGSFWKPRAEEIFDALLPSMQAHIRMDLPRSIATCYQLHYAGIPDTSLADFKSDFDKMMPVFTDAGDLIMKEIGVVGQTMQGMYPAYFELEGERNRTWEKAEYLSNAMEAGGGKAAVNDRFKTNARRGSAAAHPNSGGDDFAVGGAGVLHSAVDVGDAVDWTHQPGARPDADGPGDAYEPAPEPPAFPRFLYFKQARPKSGDKLEDAIRDDQDLAALKALAEWTRLVRGAYVGIDAHASAEGDDNAALSSRRAAGVIDFMLQHGGDTTHNMIVAVGLSDFLAKPDDPEWRYVQVKLLSRGTGRQQHHQPNTNLPSEIQKKP